MEDWGISFDAYKELYHFCKQYDDKRRAAAGCLDLPGSAPLLAVGSDGRAQVMPRAKGRVGDPVARAAERREGLLRDVKMIEQAAIAADPDLYPYILRAVTTRCDARALCAPCGERQFRNAKRRFFYLLWWYRSGALGTEK